MRYGGSSSGLFRAAYVIGICAVVIGVVGTSLYSIPERKTVTLTLPGAPTAGYLESIQIKLDGRYFSHVSGGYSFQKNISYNQFGPAPDYIHTGDYPEIWIHTPGGPNEITLFLSSEPQMNFSVDLPVSQVYIMASYFSYGPSPAVSVVIHYDVSGVNVAYSQIFITVFSGGFLLLLGRGILRRDPRKGFIYTGEGISMWKNPKRGIMYRLIGIILVVLFVGFIWFVTL